MGKKNLLFRVQFEVFYSARIFRLWKAEKIINLQNVSISLTNLPLIIYLHQALPFSNIKFSLFKNPKYWFFQNIYSFFLYKSLIKSEQVIVQSRWLKLKLEELGIPSNKITIQSPIVNYDINFFKNKTGANERKPLVFFYPTSPEKYKNYELIFNTLISNRNVLLKAGVRFIITLDKNDSKIIKNYYNILQNLQIPIEFVGRLEPNKIYEIMTESVLIFPSLVETFGLPLLEAMTLNRRILAADLPYANEVLCGYENVSFFNPKSKEELFKLMNIEIDKSLIKTGIKKMLNSY